MIRKFAAVPGTRLALAAMFLMILAGATTARAQQPSTAPAQAQPTPDPQQPSSAQPAQQPSTQQPSSQQSSSQETTDEDVTRRKAKPKDYRNWTFNVGGGASLTNGATKTFVRGGGGIAAAGVARNYSKYFGFRFDFQWDNLPLRTSTLQLAQAPGASNHVYSLMLDPIINIPVTRDWSGYVLIGPSYYRRSGKLDSSAVIPGSACNAFWNWWGTCFNGSIPLNKNYLSTGLNEFGYNFGGGVTRKITSRVELYGEFRYLHGTHSGITTDLRPITIGVRW
jgi:opacity protein-like surface antigen